MALSNEQKERYAEIAMIALEAKYEYRRELIAEILAEMQEEADAVQAVHGDPAEHKGWLRAINLVSEYLTTEGAK